MSSTTTPKAQSPAFGLPGRIQEPNSKPRSIALIGLGDGGGAIARSLPADAMGALHVQVFDSPKPLPEDALANIKSNGESLDRALRHADMIFVVACQGDDVGLVPVVSRIARDRNVQVTAIYVVPQAALGPDDPQLRTLRAGVHMLVVASDEGYVAAMLAALGS
jgi:cell division GTPase FtsZ